MGQLTLESTGYKLNLLVNVLIIATDLGIISV